MRQYLAPLCLAAAIVAPPAARAQQPAMTVVTLLPGDKGLVGTRAVAESDIVASVTSQATARGGLRMVTIRSCRQVAPEKVQGLMQDLQKRNFIVVIDLNQPDPRLCAR